jgi:hypothetical protein
LGKGQHTVRERQVHFRVSAPNAVAFVALGLDLAGLLLLLGPRLSAGGVDDARSHVAPGLINLGFALAVLTWTLRARDRGRTGPRARSAPSSLPLGLHLLVVALIGLLFAAIALLALGTPLLGLVATEDRAFLASTLGLIQAFANFATMCAAVLWRSPSATRGKG